MPAPASTHAPKAAIDVAYEGRRGVAACILFRDWRDPEPCGQFLAEIDPVADYQPGQFFRRELPCILAVLEQVVPAPSILVIDGFVWLEPETRPGLGAFLYSALGKTTPIIGIAKNPYRSAIGAERVVRGGSERPLWVTAAGIDPRQAAEWVESMAGEYRFPTLLKTVDSLARSSL